MFNGFEEFAHYIGTKAPAIVAGAFGAAVSMAVIKGSLAYRASLFGGGLVSAAFITPLIVNAFQFEKSENAVAFLVGMFGMSVAAAIIRTVQDINFDSLFSQLRAWFGRK